MATVEATFDKYGWPVDKPVRASSSTRRSLEEQHSSFSKSKSSRREVMGTLRYTDHIRGGHSHRWEEGAGDGLRGTDHDRENRPRGQRDKVRRKAGSDDYHRSTETRRGLDRYQIEEERREWSSKEQRRGQYDEGYLTTAATADTQRSTRSRTQEPRDFHPVQRPHPTAQNAEKPARHVEALSSSMRPPADQRASVHRDRRGPGPEAGGRQGSRKTSVTFLPSLIAENPKSGQEPRRVVDELIPRPMVYEHTQSIRPQRIERSSSAPDYGHHDDADRNSRHVQLPDEQVRATDRAPPRPRMRYPPALSHPRRNTVPASLPPTSTYGWTERGQVVLPTSQAMRGSPTSCSRATQGEYAMKPELKEQEKPSGQSDQIGHARDMLESRQPKQLPALDKEVWKDHGWPVASDCMPKKPPTRDPIQSASDSSASIKRATRVSDPYSKVQAIRERTGYKARSSTSSYSIHPPLSSIRPASAGPDQTESVGRPPPIPVKPRRELAQNQGPITPLREDTHRPGWALALHEEARSASLSIPDDPAPMYTEMPVDNAETMESPVATAYATGPSGAEDIPSDTAQRKEAVERMDDMEEEITCPICMSIMVAVHAVAPCGHTMCGACGSEWFRDNDKCPICRTTPTSISKPMVPLLPMDRLIEVWIKAKGDEWEGKASWEDRKGAWEALRIVMREEEAARGTSAGTTVEGPASGSSSDPIGMGGDDEYRIREESSNPFQPSSLFSTNPFGPFTGFGFSLNGMDSTVERPDWMDRFDPDDFDHSSALPRFGTLDQMRVPEWGVNPFMDAFGYTCRPSVSPLMGQRHVSAPATSTLHLPQPHRHRTNGFRPGGFLDGMMDLVDTFTRHRSGPMAGLGGGSGMGYGHDGRGRDLDGLEQGMARLFADLRQEK